MLLTPKVAHHIERPLELARAQAQRDGSRLPDEVAVFLEDVRAAAEWFRRHRVTTDATDAILRDSSDDASDRFTLSAVMVGELLGVSGHGVTDLVRRGRLPGRKVAGRWMFDVADVDEELARRSHREEDEA